MKSQSTTSIIKLNDAFALGRLVPVTEQAQPQPKKQNTVRLTPKFLHVMDSILKEDKKN